MDEKEMDEEKLYTVGKPNKIEETKKNVVKKGEDKKDDEFKKKENGEKQNVAELYKEENMEVETALKQALELELEDGEIIDEESDGEYD